MVSSISKSPICIFLVFSLLFFCAVCFLKQSGETISSDTPLILWWSDLIFPHVDNSDIRNALHIVNCPNSKVTCLATRDHKVIHDTTDRWLTVVHYGTDFQAYEAPLPRKKNHLWALFHEESPQNNQMLSHKEALSLFNFTSTFKRNSDFPLTTQHIPNTKYFFSRKPFSIQEKNRHRKDGLAPLVYLQSHCDVPSDRDRYVRQLMQYIDVDSYGGCLSNKKFDDASLMNTSKMHDESLLDLLAKYKFHLAFENAVCDDYVTEKLFRPFHVGSVPVYLGSKTARDWSPRRTSVILVSDFDSPADLAEYLRFLDRDDEAYMKFLEFKSDFIIHNDLLRETLRNRTWSNDAASNHDFVAGFECYVCEKMHELKRDVKAGHPARNYIVSGDSLDCPVPAPSFGTISDVLPTNHLHRWIENYMDGLDHAAALRTMIHDQVDDPEQLWNYIERRYQAGHGALMHSEL